MINTARGGIVDENALYDALVSRWIAGAAINVLKEEPPKKNRLVGLENFNVTPHISSFTQEAIRNTERVSAQNIIDLLKGGHSPYIVKSRGSNKVTALRMKKRNMNEALYAK